MLKSYSHTHARVHTDQDDFSPGQLILRADLFEKRNQGQRWRGGRRRRRGREEGRGEGDTGGEIQGERYRGDLLHITGVDR